MVVANFQQQIISIISIILILVLWPINVNGQQGNDEKWKLNSNRCTLTDAQWKIIAWYFERAPYIELTEIIENIAINSNKNNHFINEVLNELLLRIGKRVKIQTVDLLTDEGNVTNTQTYGWHGVRFDTISNATNSTDNEIEIIRERDTEINIQKRMLMSPNRTREDSPMFGSLIIAENIRLIDEYLIGQPRRPFKCTRANFIIIIFNNSDATAVWDVNAARALTRLWKIYSVLNAIIISACKSNDIGYFDPFVNVHEKNDTTHHDWGVFRWVAINLIDTNDDWLLRKEYIMNGYPITATIFTRYPTAVKTVDFPAAFLSTHYARGVQYSHGLGGSDGLILGNVANALNFDAITIKPRSGTYGSRQANGSYSGTIGDVLYGRADASFNGRFIQEYDSNEIEFMFSVSADKMCVIAPAAERIPQWMAIFKCFHVYVWILLPILTALLGGFWFILKYWAYQKRTFTGLTEKASFYDILVQIFMIMLGASTTLPMRSMERYFVGSCLMANVIIIGTFQGSLTTSFSTVSYYKNLETLHDLDAVGLQIVTSSQSLRTLFGEAKDAKPLLQSLIKKFKIFEIDNPIQRTARKRDMCSVERYSDINIIIKTTYQRPDGSAFVHVIEECPRDYFLAYIVKKGWPFLARFNYVLSKFSEAGLLKLWYEQVESAFVVHHLYTNRFDVYKTQAFTFHDIQTAFYILGIGLLIATILFIIEIFFLPPSKKRKFFRKHKSKL